MTLQKIWEKLCGLEEEMRGKASHDEARASGEVSEARQTINKLEEKEEKELREKTCGRQPAKT